MKAYEAFTEGWQLSMWAGAALAAAAVVFAALRGPTDAGHAAALRVHEQLL